mgnify:CR=1 FL=1
MVTDRLTDGVRLAQLLASEVTGNESRLRGLTVVDADRDVEPAADGALAYRIARERGGSDGGDERADPLADVYVQPDRVRIEATAAPDAGVRRGRRTGEARAGGPRSAPARVGDRVTRRVAPRRP